MEAFLNRTSSTREAVFERDVESPDGTGMKSCVSAPIDDMDPDQFWDAVDKWMYHKGAIAELLEKDYTVTKCDDGGVLAVTTYGTAGTIAEIFAGKFVGTTHMKYYVDRENDEMRSYNYNTDATLSKRSMSQESVLKVWRDPFRLEFYINELEARLCGPFGKTWADMQLRGAGLQVETFCNMDSPTEPGEKSILTSEIQDPDWTFQKLWETYKATVMRDFGAQEADETTLVMEISNIFYTQYVSICLVDEGTRIVTRDHSTDETLCECRTEFWQKVIENPTRLEIWMINVPWREHGMKAQVIANSILNAIFRFARGEEVVPIPDEVKKVIGEVEKGIDAYTKEMERQKEQGAIEAGASGDGAEGGATEGSGAAEAPAAAEGAGEKSQS